MYNIFFNWFGVHMTTELMSWRSLLDLGWLLFLLLVLYYFWCARRVTLQTRTWSKTHGRVTQCAWVTYDHSLWPKIEYIYQVGDRDFTGEHFFIDTVHILDWLHNLLPTLCWIWFKLVNLSQFESVFYRLSPELARWFYSHCSSYLLVFMRNTWFSRPCKLQLPDHKVGC